MSDIKYVSYDSLLYFWQKLKLEFAKYAESSDIPTNVSDLTNDSNFQTATQVDNAITAAIAGIEGIKFEIVATLPATGDPGTIYLVAHSHGSQDVYDEFIYVNNAWEKLGTTDIDLTGYVQRSELVAVTNAEIDTIVAS